MSISSFPLYRLPSIPLNDVIEYMDPIEILSLSIASQTSILLVKELGKKLKPIDLLVDFQFSTCSVQLTQNWKRSELIIATGARESSTHPLSYWKCNDGSTVKLQFHRVAYFATIFENDKTRGFTKAIELLTSTFKVRNISLQVANLHVGRGAQNCVSSTKDEIFVKSILTSFKKHKLKIKKISLNGTYSSNEFYTFILNEGRQASELELNMKPCGTVKYGNFLQFHFDSLELYEASWVSLNNLYSFINCISIKLSHIGITVQELNSFLKTWMLGGYMLKCMSLSMIKSFDIPTIIQGLNAEVVDEVTEEMKADMRQHRLFGPIHRYKIQRADGVTANICIVDRYVFLRVI